MGRTQGIRSPRTHPLAPSIVVSRCRSRSANSPAGDFLRVGLLVRQAS
jgi:hypothetical protein